MPNCRVGERAVVGAGAVVLEPLPDDAVVGGIPARPLPDGQSVSRHNPK